MKLFSVILFATVLLVLQDQVAAFFGQNHFIHRKRFLYNDSRLDNIRADTIELPLNHFDASNNETFQNNYWYDDSTAKVDGPLFLFNSGEQTSYASEINQSAVVNKLAKKYGGTIFMIEHRFYGSSVPSEGVNGDNLKYFTSEQALADMQKFIHAMNKKFNYTSPRWIVFGGSYSGALAAWMREKYPEDVYAAIASSAPVQAVVDFTEYNEVVYDVFKKTDSKCAKLIRRGFGVVEQLIKTKEGRRNLTKSFNTNITHENAVFFVSGFPNIFKEYVQYGLPISDLCDIIKSAPTPYQGIVAVEEMANFFSQDNDYSNDDRTMWWWQTCNEFGFYQTTDSRHSSKLFGHAVPLSVCVNVCNATFGVQKQAIYKHVQNTNKNYGAVRGYTGTRVVFPNGSYDPWHVLGVLKPVNNETYTVLIEGASHCADMYLPASENIRKAQKKIAKLVEGWINAP